MKLKEVKKDLDEQKEVFIENISQANNQVRFRRASPIRNASKGDNGEIIKRIEAASQNGEKERKEE